MSMLRRGLIEKGLSFSQFAIFASYRYLKMLFLLLTEFIVWLIEVAPNMPFDDPEAIELELFEKMPTG